MILVAQNSVTIKHGGGSLTVAEVEATAEVQPAEVATFKLYAPVAAVVAPGIDGFCAEELKLSGPVQL